MFKIQYYLKEYFINKKLIGSIKMQTPDRKLDGYLGTEVTTEQHPICGRLKN